MSQARFLVGDVFDQLATLEHDSVDLIVSSPPFLALRSYLPADHPDKAREIGSEPTPGAYLDVLLDVVEACARVLAPHGSLVFELGDTYASQGGAANWQACGDEEPDRYRSDNGATAVAARNRVGNGWPLDKCKVMVPQLFAIALAYGFNPLTGRKTEPWRVRNVVAWCRPNPPVGRDGDKFRPATSYLTVACKARDRYWDGDAVRQELKKPDAVYVRRNETYADTNNKQGTMPPYDAHASAGAPLLDYWELPTVPYKGAHYATYPPDLVVPLVKSMCPRRVCRVCGEPSRRIVGEAEYVNARTRESVEKARWLDPEKLRQGAIGRDNGALRVAKTLGWSDCAHFCAACTIDNRTRAQRGMSLRESCEHRWRPGLVLDPFVGSGTTLEVATGHGLDCIGIDLDPRNAELARQRVGMFLEIVEPVAALPDNTEGMKGR